MREQYMRSGEGFLLVFSLADRTSYDEIFKFHKQVIHSPNKKENVYKYILRVLNVKKMIFLFAWLHTETTSKYKFLIKTVKFQQTEVIYWSKNNWD